jgi:hypothetical protein
MGSGGESREGGATVGPMAPVALDPVEQAIWRTVVYTLLSGN